MLSCVMMTLSLITCRWALLIDLITLLSSLLQFLGCLTLLTVYKFVYVPAPRITIVHLHPNDGNSGYFTDLTRQIV